MSRPALSEFKRKALAKASVKKEYEALSSAYNLRKQLIAYANRLGLLKSK